MTLGAAFERIYEDEPAGEVVEVFSVDGAGEEVFDSADFSGVVLVACFSASRAFLRDADG